MRLTGGVTTVDDLRATRQVCAECGEWSECHYLCATSLAVPSGVLRQACPSSGTIRAQCQSVGWRAKWANCARLQWRMRHRSSGDWAGLTRRATTSGVGCVHRI